MKNSVPLLFAAALAGCVTSAPRMANDEIAAFKGKSINDFLDASIRKRAKSDLGVTSQFGRGDQDMAAITRELTDYCTLLGGTPKVEYRAPPWPLNKGILQVSRLMKEVVCMASDQTLLWEVSASYGYQGQVDREVSYHPIWGASMTFRGISADDKRREQAAKQAALTAEQQRKALATAEKAKRDALEAAERPARNQKYRDNLKVGDAVLVRMDNYRSGEGMVIELKRPIALVQFSNISPSPQWVRIESIEEPR